VIHRHDLLPNAKTFLDFERGTTGTHARLSFATFMKLVLEVMEVKPANGCLYVEALESADSYRRRTQPSLGAHQHNFSEDASRASSLLRSASSSTMTAAQIVRSGRAAAEMKVMADTTFNPYLREGEAGPENCDIVAWRFTFHWCEKKTASAMSADVEGIIDRLREQDEANVRRLEEIAALRRQAGNSRGRDGSGGEGVFEGSQENEESVENGRPSAAKRSRFSAELKVPSRKTDEMLVAESNREAGVMGAAWYKLEELIELARAREIAQAANRRLSHNPKVQDAERLARRAELDSDPFREITTRAKLRECMTAYNPDISMANALVRRMWDDSIFSQNCPFSPFVVFGLPWAFNSLSRAEIAEDQTNAGNYGFTARAENPEYGHYTFHRPTFTWEVPLSNVRVWPLLLLHGIQQPRYIGQDFKKFLNLMLTGGNRQWREEWHENLSNEYHVQTADASVTFQQMENRKRRAEERYQQLLDARMRLIEGGHYTPDELARLAPGPVGDDHDDPSRPGLERDDAGGLTVKQYYWILRAIFTRGAKHVQIPTESAVTYDSVAAQNLEFRIGIETQVYARKQALLHNNSEAARIESESLEGLADSISEAKAFENFRPIWKGEGVMSESARAILSFLHRHLASDTNKYKNFYTYRPKRMYYDTSPFAEMLTMANFTFSLIGCTRNFHVVMTMLLGEMHQYCRQPFHFHMLMIGLHALGKSKIGELLKELAVKKSFQNVTRMSNHAEEVGEDVSDQTRFFGEVDPKIFNADSADGASSQSSQESLWKERLIESVLSSVILDTSNGRRTRRVIETVTHNMHAFCTNPEGTQRFKPAMRDRFFIPELMGEDPFNKTADLSKQSNRARAFDPSKERFIDRFRLWKSLVWLVQKLIWAGCIRPVEHNLASEMARRALAKASRLGALNTDHRRHFQRFEMLCQTATIARAVYEEFFMNPTDAMRKDPFELVHMARVSPRLVTTMEEAAFVLRLLKPQWSSPISADIFALIKKKWLPSDQTVAREEIEGKVDRALLLPLPPQPSTLQASVKVRADALPLQGVEKTVQMKRRFFLSPGANGMASIADPHRQTADVMMHEWHWKQEVINLVCQTKGHNRGQVSLTLDDLMTTYETRDASLFASDADPEARRMLDEAIRTESPDQTGQHIRILEFKPSEHGPSRLIISRARLAQRIGDPVEDAIMEVFSHAHSPEVPWVMGHTVPGTRFWDMKTIPKSTTTLSFDQKDEIPKHDVEVLDALDGDLEDLDEVPYDRTQRFRVVSAREFSEDPDDTQFGERYAALNLSPLTRPPLLAPSDSTRMYRRQTDTLKSLVSVLERLKSKVVNAAPVIAVVPSAPPPPPRTPPSNRRRNGHNRSDAVNSRYQGGQRNGGGGGGGMGRGQFASSHSVPLPAPVVASAAPVSTFATHSNARITGQFSRMSIASPSVAPARQFGGALPRPVWPPTTRPSTSSAPSSARPQPPSPVPHVEPPRAASPLPSTSHARASMETRPHSDDDEPGGDDADLGPVCEEVVE